MGPVWVPTVPSGLGLSISTSVACVSENGNIHIIMKKFEVSIELHIECMLP